MQGAEIGVLNGSTSQALLEQLPDLLLWMVDSWSSVSSDSTYFHSQDGVARLSQAEHLANLELACSRTQLASDRRLVVRAPSSVAAKGIGDGSLDFVFIDAEHTYEAVRSDIRSWWPKIRSGGILSGHDYGARKNLRGIWGVNRAVDQFVSEQRLELGRLPGNVWWIAKPTANDIPAIPRPCGRMIRVVYGDLMANVRLQRQIRISLEAKWAREEIFYFVAGTDNAQWMTRQGAKHVELTLPENRPIESARYGCWYAKTYLMAKAMEQFDEILCSDFDCRILRTPDDQMWERLRRPRSGRFQGSFLAPNVGYIRPVCLTIHRDRTQFPVRRCINSSVVYCRDRQWLDEWLSAYEDIAKQGIQMTRMLDETVLMHRLDRDFGVFDASTMVSEFENPIAWLKRNTPEAKMGKCRDEAYFYHR